MNLVCGVTKLSGGGWGGVIRSNGKVVWACPHCHTNRDQTTFTNGVAARDCARAVFSLAKMSDDKVKEYTAIICHIAQNARFGGGQMVARHEREKVLAVKAREVLAPYLG